MIVVGLSFGYHDSAACVLDDGELIAAAQEERFSRIKFDSAFPHNALAFCLSKAGVDRSAIDVVAYFENPRAKLERMLFGQQLGIGGAETLLNRWAEKTSLEEEVRWQIGRVGRFVSYPHHLSHAAGAFFSSGLAASGLLVADAVGEWSTLSTGFASGGAISVSEMSRFPHSLGLLYSAVTSLLGFQVNEDEYKVMGLAGYGHPRLLSKLEQIALQEGKLHLNLRYFDLGNRMYSRTLADELSVSPRRAGEKITQDHCDLAASVQQLLEDQLVDAVNRLKSASAASDLCMSGGVALNAAAVAAIRRRCALENVFVQPAAGDAGAAVGAAFLATVEETGERPRVLDACFLGPSYDRATIVQLLAERGATFEILESDALIERVAELLSNDAIIGWFQGRMEFGPRALGNRSILADPRSAAMRDRINSIIKGREDFRPLAPVCLAKAARDLFSTNIPMRYMTELVEVKEPGRLGAVTHVDRTARLQTINADENSMLASLLEAFENRTGLPVLLNTSFNRAGEPIVCNPTDAWRAFIQMPLDALVLGEVLVIRENQPESVLSRDTIRYMSIARELPDLSRSTYFFS